MSNRLYNQFSFSPERQPISLMGLFIQASALAPATLIDQDIEYDAVVAGSAGNNITIRYIDPGVNGALSISVTGTAITATLARAGGVLTTTANDLVSAIQGNAPASALVNISIASGDGTNVLTALPTTHLAAGADRVMTTNALNMSMTQTGDGLYTIQLQDEFPAVLSAQVTLLLASGADTKAQIASADTAFGTSKTIVIRLYNTSVANLSAGDGMFVHLIMRNSSN